MKETVVFCTLLLCITCFSSCDSENQNSFQESEEWRCGFHNGKQLWTGPRGGCYYKNSNGNKTYVDRSECNC